MIEWWKWRNALGLVVVVVATGTLIWWVVTAVGKNDLGPSPAPWQPGRI